MRLCYSRNARLVEHSKLTNENTQWKWWDQCPNSFCWVSGEGSDTWPSVCALSLISCLSPLVVWGSSPLPQGKLCWDWAVGIGLLLVPRPRGTFCTFVSVRWSGALAVALGRWASPQLSFQKSRDNLPAHVFTGHYYGWADVGNQVVHKLVVSLGRNVHYSSTRKSMETHYT